MLARTSAVPTRAPDRRASTGTPAWLVRRKRGGRSPAAAIERPTSADSRSKALQVPKALIAAMMATIAPALEPRIGAMASAKGALLSAATRLGRSISVAMVAVRYMTPVKAVP